MSVAQMSSISQTLYHYKEDFLKQSLADESFAGKVNYHIIGRVLNLSVSLILHAEAVCRAVYACFLSLREIFSASDEELFTQIHVSQAALGLSFRSFCHFFFMHPPEVAPSTPLAHEPEGSLIERDEEKEGSFTFVRRSVLHFNLPVGFSYSTAPTALKFDPRFSLSENGTIGVCHFVPPGGDAGLFGLNSDHIEQLLEGGQHSVGSLAADLVYSAASTTGFKLPLSCLVVSSTRSGQSSLGDDFERISDAEAGDSPVMVETPVKVYDVSGLSPMDLSSQPVPRIPTPTLSDYEKDFGAPPSECGSEPIFVDSKEEKA